MAGVKDVIDHFQINPVSMMDDRMRLVTARTLYAYPTLSKYASDPAKPIRIVVQNGDVTLEGMLISRSDKEVAGLRSNTVPGVFKVANNPQVVNQQTEHN